MIFPGLASKKRLVLLLGLFFALKSPLSLSNSLCPLGFENVGERIVHAGRTVGKEVVAAAARTAVVPINPVDLFQIFYWPVIPIKMIGQTLKKLNSLTLNNRSLKPEDFLVVPIKVAYGNKHLLVGGYLVHSVANQRDIWVTDYLAETAEFEDELGQKPYFFVNAINEDKNLGPWAANRFETIKGSYPKVGVFDFTNEESLVDSIIEFSKAQGEPLYGL